MGLDITISKKITANDIKVMHKYEIDNTVVQYRNRYDLAEVLSEKPQTNDTAEYYTPKKVTAIVLYELLNHVMWEFLDNHVYDRDANGEKAPLDLEKLEELTDPIHKAIALNKSGIELVTEIG